MRPETKSTFNMQTLVLQARIINSKQLNNTGIGHVTEMKIESILVHAHTELVWTTLFRS